MKKIFIAAAKRTAIGTFNGSLATVPATQLGTAVVTEILAQTSLPPAAIDEVLVGNVLPAGCKQGIARQVAIGAGIPKEVPAYTINMVCGSGMKAVMNACTSIMAGLGDVYLAGGTENMSRTPYLIQDARTGLRMGNKQLLDHMMYDALHDAFEDYHMGITAEHIAEKYGISRLEQDTFAIASQNKAIAAIEAGAFAEEITPITVVDRKKEFIFDTDEHPNRATSLEKLQTLRPAFQKEGTVTAGNSSGINDGAAFLLIVSEEALAKYNLTPLAEIVGFGQGGVDPAFMGMGPVPAIGNALAMCGLPLADIDLLELNEAFAAQALGVVEELATQHKVTKQQILEKTNLNGGAIALGHPVGASGARITVSLVHAMQKRDAKLGLASLCIGGGMGTAIILRRV